MPSQRWSGMRLALAIALALLVAVPLAGVLSSGSIVSAQATTIDGGTWGFDPASTGNAVEIKLTDLPPAGLGAADVSVAFDSAVLEVTACTPGDLSGACNANAPGGPARAAGFAAPAITTEPVVIATLTFDCVGAAGTSSALTITVNVLKDGTPGAAQPVAATVRDGAVACGAAATPAPTPPAMITDPPAILVTPTPTPTPAPGQLPDSGGAPAQTGDGGRTLLLALIAAALGLAVAGGALAAVRR